MTDRIDICIRRSARTVALVGAAVVAGIVGAQTRYNFVDLGPDPDYGTGESYAYGVNDLGQILFGRYIMNGPGGSLTPIPSLPGTTSRPRPEEINNNGEVTGAANDAAGVERAFFYNGATTVDLGAFGSGLRSQALSLNSLGTVVGYARTGSALSTRRAARFSGGTVTNIATGLQNTANTANAINDAGQIIGTGRPIGANSDRALLFDGAGNATELPFIQGIGHDRSQAFGINNTGLVVGQSSGLTADTRRAVAWDLTAGTTIQYTQPAGTTGSWVANDVNDAGVAIGPASLDGIETRGAVFQNGVGYLLQDLVDGADPNFVLRTVNDINNLGWIVGYGQIDGINRAFLLVPQTGPQRIVPDEITVGLGQVTAGNVGSLGTTDSDVLRVCRFVVPFAGSPYARLNVFANNTGLTTLSAGTVELRDRSATAGLFRRTLLGVLAGGTGATRDSLVTNGFPTAFADYSLTLTAGSGALGDYLGTNGRLGVRYEVLQTGPSASLTPCSEIDKVNWVVTP